MRAAGLVSVVLLAVPTALPAQTCGGCAGADLPVFLCQFADPATATNPCRFSFPNCVPPMAGGTRIDILPAGGGNFEARLVVSVTAPSNTDPNTPDGARLNLYWAQGSTPTNPTTSLCQAHAQNRAETYLAETVNCAGAPYDFGLYSVRAVVCEGISCQKMTDFPGLPFKVTKSMLGCPEPPKSSCCDNLSCKECKSIGPGGTSVGGGGACAAPPDDGPGALLRYRAGGAGGPGWPGTGPWNQRLGRYWSHEHAERIVVDPNVSHVWLITKSATFREFGSLAAPGPRLRAYARTANSPSDEYRQLSYDDPAAGGTGGWQLQDLDGTVQYFLSSGLWDKTLGKNPANVTQAAYTAGALSSVTFPDGRSETYTYDATTGKLASITEVGVANGDSRTWTYAWTGDDLTGIGLPDGESYQLFYADANHPGDLTRIDQVGTDGTRRIESAWSYDANGNVSQIWRGDPVATGPAAADLYSFTYDNAQLPAQVNVTDPFSMVTAYTVARDTVSQKPKVTRIQGDCPTCGVGPNSVFTYGDTANPLLPTEIVDGRGLHTQLTYDAYGQVTQKLEAAGTSLQRDLAWQYHPTFHAFPTLIDQPSTSGGAARRQATLAYDAQGNLTSRTITGAESGSAFSFTTAYPSYNNGGQPLSVDPPGYNMSDVTTFTYDATRGNGFLLPLSRTDPLVGATQYSYDPFNRRTQVTDVNGVATVTAYDRLNRVTSVTRKGATTVDDLITSYAYNTLGDLFRTTLPRGNVVEYGYDAVGRLVTIERKPDATTHGERTLYTLDAVGHRTREELQHWSGSAWMTDSQTDFVYSTRCHLDRTIRQDGSQTGAVTELGYDCDDNLAQVWDARHPKSTNPPTQVYAYDELNRLKSVTQPWAVTDTAVTSYGYDVQDHLNSVTDANGNITTYIYSDRDLMTRQVSPVSGETDSTYNEHGELTSEIDARGLRMNRTIDALDRVTLTTYPDTRLNVTYTYDAGSFAKGRLTGITRYSDTIAYAYDRFGRLTQDGALTYTYDGNDNRTSIGYPGGATATYTFDFADREQSLTLQVGTNPALSLAGPATYKPFGPLASLPLGNGLTETRTYDSRYLPGTIQLTSPSTTLLNWSYTLDAIGNVTAITDQLAAANNRTYGYLDINYFLTRGDGPWGTRSWSYDKIGNRLTETRSGVTDTYTYVVNSAVQTPKLGLIALGGGGIRRFSYDASGNTIQIVDPTQQLDLIPDAANRLGGLRSVPSRARTVLNYDGRGFLRQAYDADGCCVPTLLIPTYSSEGRLERRAHFSLFNRNGPAIDTTLVLYFAGRPVALYKQAASTPTLTYLTTDHLGTPVAATSSATPGVLLWQGGFEPFGADWSGAGAAGVFLRFPGQWEDGAWAGNTLQSGLYQNVFRWYQSTTGRYTRPDPFSPEKGAAVATPSASHYTINPLIYAAANPLNLTDPLGLKTIDVTCAIRWFAVGAAGGGLGGAVLGCLGGGGLGTLLEPGGGTLLGCFAGSSGAAQTGALAGAQAGAIIGLTVCSCKDRDDEDRDSRCERLLAEDNFKCSQWWGSSINKISSDYLRACRQSAVFRYSECLRFGHPRSPLSPHPFQY
jgi:RHS repeat-associated protein